MTLQKRSEGTTWPELMMGDKRAVDMSSDEQDALFHERLSDLTSEDLVQLTSTFNLQIRFNYYHCAL